MTTGPRRSSKVNPERVPNIESLTSGPRRSSKVNPERVPNIEVSGSHHRGPLLDPSGFQPCLAIFHIHLLKGILKSSMPIVESNLLIESSPSAMSRSVLPKSQFPKSDSPSSEESSITLTRPRVRSHFSLSISLDPLPPTFPKSRSDQITSDQIRSGFFTSEHIFSIPHLMLCGEIGHNFNQWVKTSQTTPLPGLSTLGEISLYMTSLSLGEISPNLQRPKTGVVGLVLSHWLSWCPLYLPSTTFYFHKLDRYVLVHFANAGN